MRFPFFDGKTPLTKDAMNEIIAAVNETEKLTAAPPLEVHDLGAMGRVTRLGVAAGGEATGSGFWARLNETADVVNWAECMPGTDPVTGEQTLVERPGGRSGQLDPLCALLQGMGNLRPLHGATLFVLRFTPAAMSGTFSLSYQIDGGPTRNCPSVNFDATPAALELALNTPAAGKWRVAGVAGSGYILGIATGQGNPDNSTVTLLSNTTTSSGVITTEKSYTPSTSLLNFLPGGQIAWVRPVTDLAGATRYLLSLPYCGIWARIRASAGSGLYTFIEQVQHVLSSEGLTRGSFIDDADGISGTASEINGESLVPPNTVVWMTPVWKAGVGFAWAFQAMSDWRFIVVPADYSAYPDGCQGTIYSPRACDVYASVPYAQLQEEDGSPSVPQAGNHLACRIGFTAAGWPLYLRVSGFSTGWSGTMTVEGAGDTNTLVVENGLIVQNVVT